MPYRQPQQYPRQQKVGADLALVAPRTGAETDGLRVGESSQEPEEAAIPALKRASLTGLYGRADLRYGLTRIAPPASENESDDDNAHQYTQSLRHPGLTVTPSIQHVPHDDEQGQRTD